MKRIRCVPVFGQHATSDFLQRRSGISTLEVIGAFAAVSAGIWLGAMYLEIDLREAWNLAAGKAGIGKFEIAVDEPNVETFVEEDFASVGQDLADQGVSDAAVVDVEAANGATDGEVVDEIEKLRDALKRLESSRESNAAAPNVERSPTGKTTESLPKKGKISTKQAIGKRTLAYWKKLNQIMLKEEQLRRAPASGLTADNAGAFLAGRGKASRFAANTIRKLPTKNIDPVVLNLARDIAKWYDGSAELNDQAVHLFHEADPATRRGPLGQSWSTAEKQHQNEVRLLNQRGDSVRKRMITKYGVAFPDLR